MVSELYWHGFPLVIWHQLASTLILLVVLAPAAISDYRYRKVANGLSMSGWIIGPIIGMAILGTSGLNDSLLGLLFMLGIMFPLWMIHWFGAADVKLLGSVGALVGFSHAPQVLLGVVLAGALISLTVLVYKKRVQLVLLELFTGQFIGTMKAGKKALQEGRQSADSLVVPYAIPIALGTMFSLVFIHYTKH